MLFPVVGEFENRPRLPSGCNGVVMSSCVPLYGAVTLRVCTVHGDYDEWDECRVSLSK